MPFEIANGSTYSIHTQRVKYTGLWYTTPGPCPQRTPIQIRERQQLGNYGHFQTLRCVFLKALLLINIMSYNPRFLNQVR